MHSVNGDTCNFCRGYVMRIEGNFRDCQRRDWLFNFMLEDGRHWAAMETEHCSWGQRTWAAQEVQVLRVEPPSSFFPSGKKDMFTIRTHVYNC